MELNQTENLKLLVLGLLVAAAMALGVSFAMPSSFTRWAILLLPTQAATAIVSPLVLDAVVASLNLAEVASVDAARQRLACQMKQDALRNWHGYLDSVSVK